ncbi:hypothetical protein HMPREF0372_02309 [Flavonifractor plautii ATCC 29863]|uniref:Uncharacterized protein n=1 Tax=Flavonifractor plautii ATCC 29863 TaxID=411475 RepID=G9YS04_FLAPL|nr:hypothetical protein HMPREF0372_02309 [Flavonifractor plautii ATCC 29863]
MHRSSITQSICIRQMEPFYPSAGSPCHRSFSTREIRPFTRADFTSGPK